MPSLELSRGELIARNVGVGCVMTFAGFFGGGMIAVLIAKIVGSVQGLRYEGASSAFAAALFPKFLLPSLQTSLEFVRNAMFPMWV